MLRRSFFLNNFFPVGFEFFKNINLVISKFSLSYNNYNNSESYTGTVFQGHLLPSRFFHLSREIWEKLESEFHLVTSNQLLELIRFHFSSIQNSRTLRSIPWVACHYWRCVLTQLLMWWWYSYLWQMVEVGGSNPGIENNCCQEIFFKRTIWKKSWRGRLLWAVANSENMK